MIRNMVLGSIGIIGVGEGGCNVANKFEKLGYKTFYINSAMKDLNKLETNSDNTYHITDAKGCVRDRDKAKSYLKNNYDIILSNIKQRMGNLNIIFVVFSMGGGTGSGMSPMLMNGLMAHMPNSTFGSMGIIPDNMSSAKMKANTCECYSELKKLKDRIGNCYFIDNNGVCENNLSVANLDTLDKSFVSRINDLVNVSDSMGSVDEAEITTLLTTSGNVLISEILPNIKEIENRLVLDMSLIPVDAVTEYLLYSIRDNSNYVKDLAESMFGIPEDNFIAYNDNSEFVASFGMPFPEEKFIKLREDAKDIMQLRDEVKDDVDFELDSLSSLFKSKLPKSVKDKAVKNSKDLLAELEDF